MISTFSAECPICNESKFIARINLPMNHAFFGRCPTCGFPIRFFPEWVSKETCEEFELPSDFRRKESEIAGQLSFY